MKNIRHARFLTSLAAATILILVVLGCGRDTEADEGIHDHAAASSAHHDNPGLTSQDAEEIAVKTPPFSDGIFPCNDCHIDIEPNPAERDLEYMHEDISAMFDHDKENRWCLDCHDNRQRDSLRLASGKLIGFDESYRLCGQCHGDKLRDWKVGVHGKRTGYWNGPKQYLLCVHCHNPHSPNFQSLKPLPPPIRQGDIYM